MTRDILDWPCMDVQARRLARVLLVPTSGHLAAKEAHSTHHLSLTPMDSISLQLTEVKLVGSSFHRLLLDLHHSLLRCLTSRHRQPKSRIARTVDSMITMMVAKASVALDLKGAVIGLPFGVG